MNSSKNNQERRRSPRFEADGVVHLSSPSPGCTEVTAHLTDKSSEGFRAAHSCRELLGGDRVQFSLDGVTGVARVMWTRISESAVESGFWIESQ